MIAQTPTPPYYAVIFTSIRTEKENDAYEQMAIQMVELGATMPGFLGIESARNDIGITVSYWDSLENIAKWRYVFEHKHAQEKGRTDWYKEYKTRICLVQRDYGFELKEDDHL